MKIDHSEPGTGTRASSNNCCREGRFLILSNLSSFIFNHCENKKHVFVSYFDSILTSLVARDFKMSRKIV